MLIIRIFKWCVRCVIRASRKLKIKTTTTKKKTKKRNCTFFYYYYFFFARPRSFLKGIWHRRAAPPPPPPPPVPSSPPSAWEARKEIHSSVYFLPGCSVMIPALLINRCSDWSNGLKLMQREGARAHRRGWHGNDLFSGPDYLDVYTYIYKRRKTPSRL